MRHDRPEQRLEFANLLTQKLSAIADEISILERQFGKVIYAREIPEYRQQLENSFTQSQTHNQPPYANQKQATAPAFAMWSQPPLQQPQPSMFHSFGPPMASSTTAATVAATSGFEPDDEDDDVNEFERRLHQRSSELPRILTIVKRPSIFQNRFLPHLSLLRKPHEIVAFPPTATEDSLPRHLQIRANPATVSTNNIHVTTIANSRSIRTWAPHTCPIISPSATALVSSQPTVPLEILTHLTIRPE